MKSNFINRRTLLLSALALTAPSILSAEITDKEWKKSFPEIRKAIAAAHPEYKHSKIVGRNGKVHLISGGEFDVDYEPRALSILLVPIADKSGVTASEVTARLYRKTGWGDTKTVAKFTDSVSVTAKGRRSYRVNQFSAPCVVLWIKDRIPIESGLAPGCHPAPLTYEEGQDRGCG